MKKIFLIVVAAAFLYSFSNTITPPAAVKKAFAAKFPTATKVTWGKESAKEWEAEFTFEGNKISANFYQDGTWLETERQIKSTELPQPVAAAIRTKYPGWTIIEADMTETSKHGTIYESDLKKGTAKKSVAFKANGSSVTE